MFDISGLTLLILMIGVITERVTMPIVIGTMIIILVVELIKWYLTPTSANGN